MVTFDEYLRTPFAKRVQDFIKQKTSLALPCIIKATDSGVYYLDIPVDTYRSGNFYIEDNTLFLKNTWLGTISNKSQDIYLRGDALTYLFHYQPPADIFQFSHLSQFSMGSTSSNILAKKSKIRDRIQQAQKSDVLSKHVKNSIFKFDPKSTITSKDLISTNDENAIVRSDGLIVTL
ncbi:MAG: hypothetical protein ACO1N3_05090 [Gammaproteobacteria bacterium]